MAVLSPIPTQRRSRSRPNPVVLWHLLSLDAPTVAALWTWFVAASVHLTLPASSVVSMALAVWLLYASDRLLDARHLITDPLHTGDLELRHRFHHRHRRAFLLALLTASVLLAALLPGLTPAALHLYLILGALVAGYFVLIHATGSAHRLPKEIAVGPFFAAAIFIPTIARIPSLRLTLFPAALVFALLCSLNCLFIYAWEHDPERTSRSHPSPDPLAPNAHPATRFALRHLLALTTLVVLVGLSLTTLDLRIPPVISAACTLSALALLALHGRRHHLSATTLRAAADLALLTPAFLFPLATLTHRVH